MDNGNVFGPTGGDETSMDIKDMPQARKMMAHTLSRPHSRHSGGHAMVRANLRQAGLRPTRQRIALAELLFGAGDRHISAEQLAQEADEADIRVSLATIYNTLNQFTDARLLREIAIDGTRTYFDTNMSPHHHFFIEGENRVLDVAADAVVIDQLPPPPDGLEVASVDVVIRLRKKV